MIKHEQVGWKNVYILLNNQIDKMPMGSDLDGVLFKIDMRWRSKS